MRPDPRRLRWLDASLNRAREALRVLEDLARYGEDDREGTRALKRLRHAVAGLPARLGASAADLLAARDAARDVGRGTSPAPGAGRDVAAANHKRLQEALRSIEEWARAHAPRSAAAVERIRFDAYEAERHAAGRSLRASLLAGRRLYWVADARALGGDPARAVRRAAAAGVDVLQLREKGMPARSLLRLARTVAAACRHAGVLFILNDRADLAAACGADGVHLGQDDLPLPAARAIVGERAVVGCSTHSVAQARAACRADADYIGCGPVFATPTKPGRRAIGLAALRAMLREAARAGVPAFAIGGIDVATLPRVLRAGAHRVAVVRAVSDAPDRAAAIRRLARPLRRATGGRP